jgi:hypothetical protein
MFFKFRNVRFQLSTPVFVGSTAYSTPLYMTTSTHHLMRYNSVIEFLLKKIVDPAL